MKFEYNNNQLVLFENGKKIGWIVFGAMAKGNKKILTVFVSPDMRGQGIAKILMQKAVDIARTDGFLMQAVCPYATSFFKKYPSFNDVVLNIN